MQLGEIMLGHAATIRPDATLQEAAQEMAALDVDLLTVLKDDEPVGVITDRDITLRATANGFDPKQAQVRCAMTEGLICGCEAHEVKEAVSLMKSNRIQQLPVLDHDNKLVGIVSLGDLAHVIDLKRTNRLTSASCAAD